MPPRVAGGFERRERAVGEAGEERAASSIVTSCFLPVRLCVRSLTNVSVIAVTRADRPVQPHGRIDAMGEQVAGDAAARDARVEPPQGRSALRQIGGNGPVLQEFRAIMEDAAEPSFVDQLLGERDGGDAAIIVPDHVRTARRLDRRDHPLGLGGVSAERLFAHHHFPRFRGGDRDLRMRVVGARDVDEVDVLPANELAPVRLEAFIAPIPRERLGGRRIAGANRFENRLSVQVEKLIDPGEGVRVRPPHEPAADKTNVERPLRAHSGPSTRRVSVSARRRRGSPDLPP